MKRLTFITFLVGLMYNFLSCNPSDFELPAYQANIYIPVLDIELSIADLILADTSEIIQEDTAGFVSLHYDISESRTFEEIVPIDDQHVDFTIPGIPGEIPDFEIDIPIIPILLGIDIGLYPVFNPAIFNYEGEVDIEEFIKAEFDSGSIGLEITNNFPLVLNAGLVIELVNKEEVEPFINFTLDANVNPGQKYIFEDQDLANNFLTGNFTFRIKDLSTPGGNDILITLENSLDFRISYSEIVLRKATFMQPELDLPSLTLDVPLIFPNGARIQRARLDSGQLLIEIPELDNVLILKLTLLTAIQDGNPLSFDLSNKTEISLDNLVIDLTTKLLPFNILPIELQLVLNDSIETFDIEFDKPLDGFLDLTNFDYDFLTGYLGTSDELLEASTELDFFNRIRSGTLDIGDPQITISIGNGLGATATLRDDGGGLYIKGSNERLSGDKEESFGGSLDGFTLAPASFPGEMQTSVYKLDKSNEPNFGAFISLLPTYIEVRLPLQAGTDEIIMYQFLKDDALIKLDLGLELPLNLAADRFIISDTIEFSFDLDPDKFEAQSISVEARFESYYPVELTFQTLFLDDNYELLDSLFEKFKVVDPAVIGEDGKVTEPLVQEFFAEFEKKDLDNFRNVAFAVPFIRLHTPDGQSIRLYSSYKLKIKVKGEIFTDIDWRL